MSSYCFYASVAVMQTFFNAEKFSCRTNPKLCCASFEVKCKQAGSCQKKLCLLLVARPFPRHYSPSFREPYGFITQACKAADVLLCFVEYKTLAQVVSGGVRL